MQRAIHAVILSLLLAMLAGSAGGASAVSGYPSKPVFAQIGIAQPICCGRAINASGAIFTAGSIGGYSAYIGGCCAPGASYTLEVQQGGSEVMTYLHRNQSLNGVSVGRLEWDALNAASARVPFASIAAETVSTSTGAHYGRWKVQLAKNGTLTDALLLDPNNTSGAMEVTADGSQPVAYFKSSGAAVNATIGLNVPGTKTWQLRVTAADSRFSIYEGAGTTERMSIDTAGAVRLGGTSAPRVLGTAMGNMTTGGTVSEGVNLAYQSHSATGQYGYTLSGFTATPVCVVSAGAAGQVATVSTVTSNFVGVVIVNSTDGAAADIAHRVICQGF